MDKKVGIVSCYFKHNYGSMLQAFATQQFLDNIGIENETINIERNIDFAKGKKKYYITQITNLTFIKYKLGMVKLKFEKKKKKNLGKNITIRDKKFKEFETKFRLTKAYKTYQELTEKCKDYSSVLVGSDQLWLPVNVVADYYTLNWVPDNVNKISYATSIGISSVPNKYKNNYKNFLNRIDNLSVRETTGVKLVSELSEKKATLVCDPTLLLTKQEWMKIQQEERIIKDKYILCYFLGSNIEHRKFAERLKEKTGYKIVSLNHLDEYVKYSDIFADETPYDIGPAEWINLIRNAEFVCTDSFHGTVFSLINNTKFFTFERYSSKNSNISTNSRIYSLLEIVNLKERILSGTEKVEDVLSYEIDFKEINKKLDKFRCESRYFLENALNKSKIQEKRDTESNKVKVLYFVDRMRHGGIQQLAIEIAKQMKKDITIDFMVLNDGQKYALEDKIKELGYNLYKIDTWINKPLDYIDYYRKINSFFKEHHDYKVVHINTSSKNFLILKIAKKYGIPVRIAHSHNIGFQSENKAQILIGNMFKPLLKKYATHYFACSKKAGKWLFGKENVENSNVKIIHNAVDYQKFKLNEEVRKDIRKELNIEDKLVIGHVGRFTNQKNHKFLINIFNEIYKKNKNTVLMLVGTGEKENEIKEITKSLNIEQNVFFMGFKNNVNELMWAMDVFLMPSLYEGLPVVGVEAQATGMPCFMSKDVITDEVKITSGVKFISLDKNAEKWADEILNSDLRRKNTEGELKKAGYFIDDMAVELAKLYKEL